MPSFGASGLASDWLSGGSLSGAVGLGMPDAVAPKEPSFDWNTWSPTTPVKGIDDRGGATTFQALGTMMNQYAAQHPHASLAAPVGGGSTSGSVALGGDWAGVDQWGSAISSAASQTGVDPNLIKAVMKEESGGDPNAAGAPGVWGPMQVYSGAWGNGPWMTDPTANILKGAQILKQFIDENGGNVREGLRHYHGIGTDYVNGVASTTDQQYADIVLGNYNQLKQGAGAATGAGFSVGAQAGPALTDVFGGGANVQDWGAFNVPSTNGLYGYGTDYGLNGTNHTGVDVVVPYGTPYKAAFSGRVVCAGTGNGDGTDSCAAFQDAIGGGAGRVEIMSDDGNVVLIYGHSSQAYLQPGAHVAAGQSLGASGGENSPHVHVEARVRDSSTPSGWRIVDPAPYINGGGTFSGGSAAPLSPLDAWRQRMTGGATGAAGSGSLLDQWRMTHVGG